MTFLEKQQEAEMAFGGRITVLTIVAAVVCSACAAGENLVKNPDFEDGFSNWIRHGKGLNLSIDENLFRGGRRSLRIESTAGSNQYVAQRMIFQKPTDKPINFSAFYRTENVSGGGGGTDWSICLAVVHEDGTTAWPNTPIKVSTTAWRKVTLSYAPAKRVTQVVAHLIFRKSKGTVWFDDVHLSIVKRTAEDRKEPTKLPRDPKNLFLENRELSIEIKRANLGFGIANVRNPATGYAFSSGKGELLWRILFRQGSRGAMDELTNLHNADRTHELEKGADGDTLHLFWRGIDLGKEKGVIDVTCSVRLPKRSALSYWTIHVTNRSKMNGVWEVDYPIFSGITQIGEKGDDDTLFAPIVTGLLNRNPTHRLNGYFAGQSYPSYRNSMQFYAFYDPNELLYLATYDGRAQYKTYQFALRENELAFVVKTYPAHMGIPQSSFTLGYEAVLGVGTGDWFTAAKTYRKWALKQKWCAKGPIAARSDTSRKFKDIALWHHIFIPPRGPRDFLDAQKFYGVPQAAHYYAYPHFGFYDDSDPAYLPIRNDIARQWNTLKENGFFIMPYTNARLWNLTTRRGQKMWEAENGRSCAVKNANGELVHHPQQPKGDAVVLCPHSSFLQELMANAASRFADLGADGIYIDQIAAASPCLCFDPSHRHPPGGGSLWADGYRELLKKVRRRVKKRDFFYTTESISEAWIDVIDGHLGNGVAAACVPAFEAVYHDYATIFGGPSIHDSNLQVKRVRMGTQFVHGHQLGWGCYAVIGQSTPGADYLKTLAQAYHSYAKRFLLYGEMLRPVRVRNRIPTVQSRGDYGTGSCSVPEVLTSAWKDANGRIGLIFTNASDTTQTIDYTVDPKEYLPQRIGRCSLWRVDSSGVEKIADHSSAFTRSDSLAPKSVFVLELRAQQ